MYFRNFSINFILKPSRDTSDITYNKMPVRPAKNAYRDSFSNYSKNHR